jgi:hypothetical protein
MEATYRANRIPKQPMQAKTANPIDSNLLAKELYSHSEEKDSSIPKSRIIASVINCGKKGGRILSLSRPCSSGDAD